MGGSSIHDVLTKESIAQVKTWIRETDIIPDSIRQVLIKLTEEPLGYQSATDVRRDLEAVVLNRS